MDERFEDDVKIPKYIKRLINRYSSVGELKERLILNHIILFYNVFKQRLLLEYCFKMESDDYSVKTFLIYLDHMPDVELINGRNLINSDIRLQKLRQD